MTGPAAAGTPATDGGRIGAGRLTMGPGASIIGGTIIIVAALKSEAGRGGGTTS